MRIASLISAGTEMLFALGLGEQVVAISHECDWPPQCVSRRRVTRSNVNAGADSQAIDAQVRNLVASGQPLYEIDVAALIELRPDLIVTQAQCDVCAVRYADVVEAVRQSPVLAGTQVIGLNPQSIEDVLAEMLRIGAAAGAARAAETIVGDLRARVERIRAQTAEIPPGSRPRTLIVEWREPLMLAGNWVPELLAIAGGRCELTKAGEHSGDHEWPEVIAFDPKVVLVCPCGFDLRRCEAEARLLVGREGFRSLSAARKKQVYAVDGNSLFNRPGPRLVDSVELLAALVHPKRFEVPEAARSLYSVVSC